MESAFAVALGIFCLSGVFLLLRKPHYTIVLLMLAFLIEQTLQAYFTFLVTGGTWIVNVATGTLALVAVANRFMQGKQLTSGYFNPAFVCLLILYMWSWINAFWSPGRENALAMNMGGWPYWILLIGIAPMLLGDISEFRRVIIAFMVVSIIVTLFLSLNPAASYGGTGRFRVEFEGMDRRSNPLALGTAGGMLLICAVLFRPERASVWLTIVRAAGFAMGLGLAVASGSRGQVMIAVAVVVMMFPLAYPVRNVVQFFATAFGLIIVLGGILFVFDAMTSADNVARWEAESLSVALDDRWERAILMTTTYLSSPAHWIFGLGSNAYTAISAHDTGYVHNQIVEICTEQGLIGTFMLAGMLWFCFKGTRRMLNVYRDDQLMRPAVATLAGIALFGLGLAMKQGSFLGAPGVTFFWICMLGKVSAHEMRMADLNEQAWAEEEAMLEAELGDEDEQAMGVGQLA